MFGIDHRIYEALMAGQTVGVICRIPLEERKHWSGNLWERLDQQRGTIISVHASLRGSRYKRQTVANILLDRPAADLGLNPRFGQADCYDARRRWTYRLDHLTFDSIRDPDIDYGDTGGLMDISSPDFGPADRPLRFLKNVT